MFLFILRKMLNNKWMIASLLIGNILLMSMVASIPLYSDSILQRMLTRQFEQQMLERNKYPFSAEMKYSSLSVNRGYEIKSLNSFENHISQMQRDVGLPTLQKITDYSLTAMRCDSTNGRQFSGESRTLSLHFMSGMENHINITRGRLYSNELTEDGVIEVIVSEKTLVESDLLLGEEMVFPMLYHEDGSPIRIVVVGSFENSEENDTFWYYSPATFSDQVFMDQSLFLKLFIENYYEGLNFSSKWYLLTDYTAMKSAQVEQVLQASLDNKAWFDQYGTSACRLNYTNTLSEFSSSAARLNTTLWVLQTPIFILLAFFVFMVSKQILEQEKNSIAFIKSRGASRMQVILIFLGQSVIVAVISYLIGIPLGMLICRVLGASNGFLDLVSRSALPIELNDRALLYTAAAAVVSILTMVIPAFAYSKVTIVDHKRSTGKKTTRPLWQKAFLDIILLGVSIYGLYSYNNQKEFLASASQNGASIDPLLFLCSSLFIIGAGLLFLRIFPLLVRLVFKLGSRWWSPAAYASFLKMDRSVNEEQFIMLFLVLTLSIGIFNAKAARTINLNMEDGIRYDIGAQVVAKEKWGDNSANDDASMTLYFEPDFEKYTALSNAGVKLTKVQNTYYVSMNDIRRVHLMAIDTKEFGEIAWFRDDLEPEHWYNYLNAMASDARAVLVSMNFHTKLGYELGNSISFKNSNGVFFSGVICGFVDYFPTYTPSFETTGRKGEMVTVDNYLIIANLAQAQSVFGVMPYEIWMKADSTSTIYQFAEENDLKFETFRDASAEIINEKNDPVLQGTNGVLTVGFIIVLLVCFTGFLIYWILSIRSRELQFGIFRAMGMSMSSILGMLANEQFWISGVSIAVGTLIGYLASELYVPLIQLGYSAGGAIPLKVAAEASDYGRLFTIIGIMLIVCIAVLGVTISKIKIAQALKLGED